MGNTAEYARNCGGENPVLGFHGVHDQNQGHTARVVRTKKPPPSFEAGTMAELSRGRSWRREGERRRSVTPEPTTRGLSRPRLERRRFEEVGTVDAFTGEIRDWLHQPKEETQRNVPEPDGILPTDHEGPAGMPPLITRGKAVELTDMEPPQFGESDGTVPPLRKMRTSPAHLMMQRQNAPVYTAGEETEAPYERLVATPWKPSLPVSDAESDALLAQFGQGKKAREEVYVPTSVWDISTDAESHTSEAGSVAKTWNLDLPSGDVMPETITLRDPRTGVVIGTYNLNRGNGHELLVPAELLLSPPGGDNRPVLNRTHAPDHYRYEGLSSEGDVAGNNNITVAMFHAHHPPTLSPHRHQRPATVRTARTGRKTKKSKSFRRQVAGAMHNPTSTRSEPARKRVRHGRRHHHHGNKRAHGAVNRGYERYPTKLEAAVRSPPKLPAFAPPVFLEADSTENEAGPSQWVSFTEKPATPISPTFVSSPLPINVTKSPKYTNINKPMKMQIPAETPYTFAGNANGITVVCSQKSPEEKMFCTLKMARAGG